ncbi:MAG TPA: sulfurtransferase [Clostridiaceae bacterium]|nr:sulfurtransferase [Clostridiaceae bacterium]
MKNFKDRDFLVSHKDLVVIDVRKIEEYRLSHVKGAYFLDYEKDLASEVKEHGGRHPLPDREKLQEKLRSFGVTSDSRVLVYDSGSNDAAGRLWWLLKYYGLEHVHVLMGGFATTQEEDRDDVLPEAKEGDIVLVENDAMTASYEEVKAYSEAEDNGGKVVVDSRSEERYKGIVEPIDKKKGHIRNAKNIFYRKHFNADNTLRPMEEIRENFSEVDKYDDVVFHCGSGVTACTNIMLFDELGKESRLYVGSFSDFISYDENEVVRE